MLTADYQFNFADPSYNSYNKIISVFNPVNNHSYFP